MNIFPGLPLGLGSLSWGAMCGQTPPPRAPRGCGDRTLPPSREDLSLKAGWSGRAARRRRP